MDEELDDVCFGDSKFSSEVDWRTAKDNPDEAEISDEVFSSIAGFTPDEIYPEG